MDLAYVWGRTWDRFTPKQMIAEIEETAKESAWIVGVIHSVGIAGAMPVEHFARLLDHLTANRGRLWIATMIEAARHIRPFRT